MISSYKEYKYHLDKDTLALNILVNVIIGVVTIFNRFIIESKITIARISAKKINNESSRKYLNAILLKIKE